MIIRFLLYIYISFFLSSDLYLSFYFYESVTIFETVCRFTYALNANDAWLSTIDAKRTAVLQRTNSPSAIALHQPIAACFPTKAATVSTSSAKPYRVAEHAFPKCSANATTEATTNAHPLYEQSVSRELSAYANLSAAAPTATTATAATSGLYHVPDIIQPKHNTSLFAAHANRPNFSIEWKSTGNETGYSILCQISESFVTNLRTIFCIFHSLN